MLRERESRSVLSKEFYILNYFLHACINLVFNE